MSKSRGGSTFFWGHSPSDALSLALCRLGTAGLARRAPGTCGSAVAAVFAPIWFLPLPFSGRVLLLLALFFVGSLAADRAEALLKCKDPSQVVVDELVGMWITLLPFASPSLTMLVVGFVLFRFFDILKPWPVGASEYWMRGGWGVMLDDVVAGLMAMCSLWGLYLVGIV